MEREVIGLRSFVEQGLRCDDAYEVLYGSDIEMW